MAIKQFSIRLEEELLHKIRVIANKEIRSVNRQIIVLIKEGIKSYNKT